MKASELIQENCCGQLGEKQVFLKLVKNLERTIVEQNSIIAVLEKKLEEANNKLLEKENDGIT